MEVPTHGSQANFIYVAHTPEFGPQIADALARSRAQNIAFETAGGTPGWREDRSELYSALQLPSSDPAALAIRAYTLGALKLDDPEHYVPFVLEQLPPTGTRVHLIDQSKTDPNFLLTHEAANAAGLYDDQTPKLPTTVLRIVHDYTARAFAKSAIRREATMATQAEGIIGPPEVAAENSIDIVCGAIHTGVEDLMRERGYSTSSTTVGNVRLGTMHKIIKSLQVNPNAAIDPKLADRSIFTQIISKESRDVVANLPASPDNLLLSQGAEERIVDKMDDETIAEALAAIDAIKLSGASAEMKRNHIRYIIGNTTMRAILPS